MRDDSREQKGTMMHVGIVHGASGIHFVAAADTQAALMREVAGYVRRQALVQLYPQETAAVEQLLERCEEEAAVRFYFERVGARWDREWLTEDVVPIARTRGARGDVIPLFEHGLPASGDGRGGRHAGEAGAAGGEGDNASAAHDRATRRHGW